MTAGAVLAIAGIVSAFGLFLCFLYLLARLVTKDRR